MVCQRDDGAGFCRFRSVLFAGNGDSCGFCVRRQYASFRYGGQGMSGATGVRDAAVVKELDNIRKGAMEGDEVSLMVAGMVYDTGLMGTRDLDESVFWYEKAEQKGIWDAFLPLAFAYAEKGDLEKARVYFDKATRLYLFSNPTGKLQSAFNVGFSTSSNASDDPCGERRRFNEKCLVWLAGLANGGNAMA